MANKSIIPLLNHNSNSFNKKPKRKHETIEEEDIVLGAKTKAQIIAFWQWLKDDDNIVTILILEFLILIGLIVAWGAVFVYARVLKMLGGC